MSSVSNDMKLDVWKGDWGLPTVDLNCLQFVTYLKMSGQSFEMRKTSNPFRSPKGFLPVLSHDNNNKTITDFEDLVNLLKNMNYKPDEELTTQQQGEIKAYTNLLSEKLAPALQYIWWIDTKNLTKLTKPWYCEALPFPLNFYYPNKYQKNAETAIEGMFDCLIDAPDLETKLYSDAEKCLVCLSNRLGTNDYMFGNKPCSIDATLYAYLAPLLYTPFPNKALQNHLASCQNLRSFVHRISQLYYSIDAKEYEKKKREELKKVAETSNEEFPNAKRNKLFAGFVAVFSMLLYAVTTGIIKAGPDTMDRYIDHFDDRDVDNDDS